MADFQLHEFEALLFSDVDVLARILRCSPSDFISEFYPNPEDINDHPCTAPSKRIARACPFYQKTLHGPLVALDIGLSRMLECCPHFASWVDKLCNLAPLDTH